MEGTSLLGGKSWPFHRSQELSSSVESHAFGNLAVRQAEWEKQMENMDQKQAELFHFQWNLIREQLGSLTNGMHTMRQDVEAFRSTEARREVREADFARVVREVQADLEREGSSRRKDHEEAIEALAQLKQAVEHERTDRIHVVQAMEKEVSQQIKNVKIQQQQTLDADKDLSNRFEHWCMELRATLDKESGARGQKIEEVDRKLHRLEENLEKETRQRITAIEDVSGVQKENGMYRFSKMDELEREMQKIEQRIERETRDRGSSIDDVLMSLKVLSSDLERETAARKKEGEELLRSNSQWRQSSDKELRDLRELARETSSELVRGLQAEAEDRRRIDIIVRNLEIQIPSGFENERAERAALMEKLYKRHEDALAKATLDMETALSKAILEMEGRHEAFREKFMGMHETHVDLHGQHSESFAGLHGKHEDLLRKAVFFEELHSKHEQAFTQLGGRTEEIHSLLHDALSRVGPDAEARAIAAVTAAIEEATFVSKEDFKQSVSRLWEALDSHTHDVDVAAMQQSQLQAVQVRRVCRAPTPPPATVMKQIIPPIVTPTATIAVDTHDGKAQRAPSPVVVRCVSNPSQPSSPVVTDFKTGSMRFDVNSPPAFAYSGASIAGPPRTAGAIPISHGRGASSPAYPFAQRNTLPASITSLVTSPVELKADASAPLVGSTAAMERSGTLLRK